MPIPLNTLFLDTLSQVDLLACLALTDASATLHSLILDEVLTARTLCHFLCRNQYLLQHDIYGRFITSQELGRLRRAVEALRRRHGDTFYAQVLPFLGPLIGLTPRTYFEKTPLPNPEIFFPLPPSDDGSQKFISLPEIETIYDFRLYKSGLHYPHCFYDLGKWYFEEFNVIHFADFPAYLRHDVLFCGRYLTELHRCYEHCRRAESSLDDSETTVKHLQRDLRKSPLTLLHEKRTLQAYVLHSLKPFVEKGIYVDTFLSLFNTPKWKDMWTFAELGWWYSLGLVKFGSEIQPLIDSSFQSTREALLWLFLGAHHWLHDIDSDENLFSVLNADLEAKEPYTCCFRFHFEGRKEQYPVTQMLASQTRDTKVWLLKEIVRMAPEHGQCRDLGGNLFNYFIVPDEVEAELESRDFLFSVLLQEITDSPMQYLFEHSIGLAISYYLQRNGLKKLSWDLTRSKGYASKLLRKNRELYKALES